MPRLPGINHLVAVRVFQRAGFRIQRQSKHIIMVKGDMLLVIPRNNPIKPYTMGAIIADAGMTVTEFRDLM